MPVTAITPYLFFNGAAEKAIALYERALGASVEGKMHYRDMPPGSDMATPENADRIMHATLTIGKAKLMLSDRPVDEPGRESAQVEITLEFDALDDMERSFKALAEGGTVTMPPHDAFWGDRFAALVDAVGIHWMFVAALKTE